MPEINQKKSNGRGGARPGAGRKAGTANLKTREIADRAAQEGITPLEFMLEVMRNEASEPRDRLNAAVSAAPYMHPRLAAIEHTGRDGKAIQHDVVLEVIGIPGATAAG